jgi:hypothetical protein
VVEVTHQIGDDSDRARVRVCAQAEVLVFDVRRSFWKPDVVRPQEVAPEQLAHSAVLDQRRVVGKGSPRHGLSKQRVVDRARSTGADLADDDVRAGLIGDINESRECARSERVIAVEKLDEATAGSFDANVAWPRRPAGSRDVLDAQQVGMACHPVIDPRATSVRAAVVDQDDLEAVGRQGLREQGRYAVVDVRARIEERDHDADVDGHHVDISVRLVATLEPLTVAELDAAISRWRGGLKQTSEQSLASRRSQLRELHDLLVRVTPLAANPPIAALAVAVEIAGAADPAAIDALAPRPRTVLRLLRAGAPLVAWQVLKDNAAGVVADPTAIGELSRSPLRPLVEAPRVFAQLPGFRDPRFSAPEDCYDLTDRVRLRHHLDEISIDATPGTLTFGGWAALDLVESGPDEHVRLLLRNDDGEVSVAGVRHRRADQAGGRGDALLRRAWSGWSVTLDVDKAGLDVGRWVLALEVEHDGVRRHAPIGAEVSDLARATTRGRTQLGGRALWWEASGREWQLMIEARRPTQWGGVLRRTSL